KPLTELMEKKFAVVTFSKAKTVQLVPNVWLTENNTTCKWPLVKGGKLTAAFKKCIKPADNWEEHETSLYRTTDPGDASCPMLNIPFVEPDHFTIPTMSTTTVHC
ncbi:unnamed protein product, partial [Allacma fusca]